MESRYLNSFIKIIYKFNQFKAINLVVSKPVALILAKILFIYNNLRDLVKIEYL